MEEIVFLWSELRELAVSCFGLFSWWSFRASVCHPRLGGFGVRRRVRLLSETRGYS